MVYKDTVLWAAPPLYPRHSRVPQLRSVPLVRHLDALLSAQLINAYEPETGQRLAILDGSVPEPADYSSSSLSAA